MKMRQRTPVNLILASSQKRDKLAGNYFLLSLFTATQQLSNAHFFLLKKDFRGRESEREMEAGRKGKYAKCVCLYK
jgi:hypothetical protein